MRSSDALTGAYGRGRLLSELREWRDLAKRDVQPCCIVFMAVSGSSRHADSRRRIDGDQF